MKKLLVLFFSILISFNSYGETICVDTDAKERDGIFYLPNEAKPYTGKDFCKYENSQMEVEGNYKDGKLIDQTIFVYYENGQIKVQGEHKYGKQDGRWISWNENGQIIQEGNYKSDKRDGEFTFWHDNGQLFSVGSYKDDMEDGKWTIWHANGGIRVPSRTKS